MAGPVTSITDVPLGDVLPRVYLPAEKHLRRLGAALDHHRSAAGLTAWHWYPDQTESGQLPGGRMYVLLVDATITLYCSGADWLELALDIAWREPRQLTVNASIEVACWCPQDHNMHQVRQEHWPVAGSNDLVDWFGAGVAMLTDVLDSGPFDPGAWRIQANLPDAPVAET